MPDQQPAVLISEAQIRDKVGALAAQIDRDYAGVDSVLLVGILKGSFIFLADLSRRITIPHAVDFIAVSSYGSATKSTGEVRLQMDLRSSINGAHVLLVEDIVDTGYTLDYLLRVLSARKPATLKTCALVRKPARKKVDVPLDYVGFEIPDKWVVGYGLDWAERYRTLPYIGWVEPPE